VTTATRVGRRRAAALLMTLDSASASRLLADMDHAVVRQVAAEMANLKDEDGGGAALGAMKQFLGELCERARRAGQFKARGFLKKVLPNVLGEQSADEVISNLDTAALEMDPFSLLRDAEPQALVEALSDEHPQTIALVLGELSPAKSAKLLTLFDEGIRGDLVQRLSRTESVPSVARRKVAAMITEKVSGAGTVEAGPSGVSRLRKVACIVRALSREPKAQILEAMTAEDEQTANEVRELMVQWSDLALVEERSLQGALRNLKVETMARALHEAGDIVIAHVMRNMSKRMGDMVEEEMRLMGSVSDEEVTGAREDMLTVLRELNEQGELEFTE